MVKKTFKSKLPDMSIWEQIEEFEKKNPNLIKKDMNVTQGTWIINYYEVGKDDPKEIWRAEENS